MKIILDEGFTLIELMLVIAILAIIAALGRDFYGNYARTVDLDTSASVLVSSLEIARGRALDGDGDRRWGVHLVNGADDYFEIFSSPTDYADAAKTVSETEYLKRSIRFSDPAEGLNKDIMFTKISATSTATSTTIAYDSAYRTISVSAQGLVE